MPQTTTTTTQDRECSRCQTSRRPWEFRRADHEWCTPCNREHERTLRGLRRQGYHIGRGRTIDTRGGLVATLQRIGGAQPQRRPQPQPRMQGGRDTRRFGVEIEVATSLSSGIIVQALRDQGLDAENWVTQGYAGIHRTIAAWKVVRDGSVSGWEVVSPPLSGADGFDQLRRALQALNGLGVTVNRSTGLHVHHDMAGVDEAGIWSIVEMYAERQGLLDRLVSQSRRRNHYCNSLSPRTVQAWKSMQTGYYAQTLRQVAGRVDRYYSVNLNAYARHGTLEFRQHQGTTDYRKVEAWVEMGQALIRAALAGTQVATQDLRSMLENLGLSGARVEYHMARAATLGA